jgi:iron complex transport system substrate-binding protein
VEVSLEAIIEYEPDLVIGYDTETITADALADVGIQLYVMPPFCDNPPKPSFDSIVDEVRFYGQLFGTSDVADPAADALAATVASAADAPVAAGKTAAALYVSSDGSAIYAYSALGMVHPQMEALGMTNVFAELSERVPEVSIEEVIDRNPDILVLLYDDTGLTPDEIAALVTDLPGASSITAVAEGAVYPLLFNYAEPPTPLVVKGLSALAEQIAG